MKNLDLAKKIFDLQTGEYQGINLTAIKNFDDFYVKQIEDSLMPLEFDFIENILSRNETIIDIGFGGGYPLLPMAHRYKEKKIIGIEARNKKAKVVQEIAGKVGIRNIKTLHSRMEQIEIDLDAIITVKAVGKITEVLNMINASSKLFVIFFKGKKVDELEPLEEREKIKNWNEVYSQPYCLSNGNERKVIVYKNKNVPHGTIKKLVKLSELL